MRNFVEMPANRAQISFAINMLPPWPRQNTCRALCSRATAASTASGERLFWVPLMAVMNSALACSHRVAVSASGSGSRWLTSAPVALACASAMRISW